MSVLNLFAKLIRRLIEIICYVYGNLRYPSKKNQLPAVENDVLLIPAVEIAQRIRERKLKAVDVVKAYLKRIEEVNPIINAVIKSREEAIREAEQIDEKLEHDWESVGLLPLLGVPFTVKDTVSVKGMPLCAGLVSRKEELASEDAKLVSNLRQAGAIPIAITNVPELAMSFETSNFLFGRTNNPYDLALIPGGSSGGEGALISSAGSIIGVGTDLGGSIRLPAYFCGIFGHKPSNDVVSYDGIFSLKVPELESLLAIGPICRYAIDLKPFLKAMAKDEISRLPKIDSVVDLSKIRIFYMLENENTLNTSVSCETKDAILKVVSHFEQTYKVQCTKVDVKKMSDGFNFFLATMAKATSSSSSSPFDGGEFNLPLEILRKLLGRSSHVASVLSLFVYVTIFSLFSKTNLDESKELKKQLIDIFGDDGVFLYPCYPNINVKHDTPTLLWHNLSYTTVFNVMNLPVTQCAFGLNKNGLPVGFQVAANELNDHLTIAVAEEIEKVFGGWVPPFIIKNQPK